jgi:hypothetical protein
MKTKVLEKAGLNFRPIHVDGLQGTAFYPNGYGVSVVHHSGSYGYSQNKWELAVLKGSSVEKFSLTYETPITGDVIGHLSCKEVIKIMKEVKMLPIAGASL